MQRLKSRETIDLEEDNPGINQEAEVICSEN